MALEVAVVGVGRWGRNHARVLSSLRRNLISKLVIVDENIARAKEVAEEYSADAVYSDVDELLSKEKNLDAAVVAVPTLYHYTVVDRLLEASDVFVEKPIAATVEQGFKLAVKSLKLNRILAVGHIERFNPIVGVAKEVVGQLGPILSVEAKRLGPGPAGGYTLNLGVGHDLMVHDADIAVYFLEDLPSRVYALARRGESFPYETEVEALFQFNRGGTAYLVASWRTTSSYKHRTFTIRTEDSVVTVDYILRRLTIDNGVKAFKLWRAQALVHAETTNLEVSYAQEEPLKLELLDFLDSVVTRRKPRVSAVEGYVALKCVGKALESAEKNAPVDISWEELGQLHEAH